MSLSVAMRTTYVRMFSHMHVAIVMCPNASHQKWESCLCVYVHRMESATSTLALLELLVLAMLTSSPRTNLLSKLPLPLWALSHVPWMRLTLASKYVCVYWCMDV